MNLEQIGSIRVRKVTRGVFHGCDYPILRGRMAGLPADLAGLVVSSDLQGRALRSPLAADVPLAGTVVAPAAAAAIRAELGLSPSDFGALLPGDYWSHPINVPKRGGYGDVRPVLDAFADTFRWVVCVPGNHDLYEDKQGGVPRCESWRGDLTLVDQGVVEREGVRIGCVGGCVGNANRPFRRSLDDQRERIMGVIAEHPDWLLMHEGPPGGTHFRPGAPMVETCLNAVEQDTVLFCGHDPWDARTQQVDRVTALNSMECVLVLTAE